jgi:predicted Zn-dependent protease
MLATGTVNTDPEIQEYIQALGMELVGHARSNEQSFQFFVVNSSVINAFAFPGGYVGMHTGLILATENESELAGVVAHEISHVTQRHISRAVYANQRASTISMAALLGALIVGVATGADGDLIAGAIGATQSVAIENQIKFTRMNEYEADRVGIGVMADAGFNPMSMADFFETLGRQTGTLGAQAPEFLLTHPVSSDRMAEARGRARQYSTVNPPDSTGYSIAKARIRLLTAQRPEIAMQQFSELAQDPLRGNTLEVRYGMALAQSQMGNHAEAGRELAALLSENESIVALHTAFALNQADRGDITGAYKTFENAMALFPRNVPLTVRYCETLMRTGQADKAHKILLDLLNNVPPTLEQVRLIAIAADTAGDTSESHYYMAEYHAMQGNLTMAIQQLAQALQSPGLDNVNRARYKARMQQFQQYLPRSESNR